MCVSRVESDFLQNNMAMIIEKLKLLSEKQNAHKNLPMQVL